MKTIQLNKFDEYKDCESPTLTPIDQNELLENWLNKYTQKRLLHIKSAKKLNKLHWTFGILNIILSAFGSIFSTVNGADIFMNHNSNYINASLHFLVLILTGIQHFSKFNLREKTHLKISNQYSEIIKIIEYQLTLQENSRNLNKIMTKYDHIVEDEPLISSCF